MGAAAVRADNLAVSLEALKVSRDAEGVEVLALAETATPGDVVEYRAVYKNTTETALAGVVAEIPVPAGLVLVAGSEKPKAAEARLADGSLTPWPALDAEGKPLPAEAIRALSWKVESLPAGESVTLSLRAVVVR